MFPHVYLLRFRAQVLDLFIFDDSLDTNHNSLRDGGKANFAPLLYLWLVGINPLRSVSLTSCIGSLRVLYDAWKGQVLSVSMLTDVPGTHYRGKFFSKAPGLSLVDSPRSSLCSLWKVTSVPSSCGLLPPSSGSTSPPTPFPPAPISGCTRSQSSSSLKRLLVCFILGDWRCPWFAERQVCSVNSVSLV